MRRIARDARLAEERLNFKGDAVEWWDSVLRNALWRRKLEFLFERLLEESPDDEELTNLVAAAKGNPGFAFDPVRDPARRPWTVGLGVVVIALGSWLLHKEGTTATSSTMTQSTATGVTSAPPRLEQPHDDSGLTTQLSASGDESPAHAIPDTHPSPMSPTGVRTAAAGGHDAGVGVPEACFLLCERTVRKVGLKCGRDGGVVILYNETDLKDAAEAKADDLRGSGECPEGGVRTKLGHRQP